MNTSNLSVALIGSGGAGVMTAGQALLEAAAQSGLYGLMSRSLGPQIRGGESAALLRLGTHPVENQGDRCDLLVAVDWGNVERFIDEIPLGPDSVVITDPDQGTLPTVIGQLGPRVVSIPLKKLVADIDNGRINMLTLGLVGTLLGLPASLLESAIEKKLGSKGDDVLKAAFDAIRAGCDAASLLPDDLVQTLKSLSLDLHNNKGAERWLLNGNDATGLGILRGGVRFVAAYPITPATEILEWLAEALPKVGGTLVQAEDELASINMAVGGAFGGVPSMTATSGPGLALMIETLGLAIAAEIPVVICNVMRGGPSTGIPTKSEQSDLNLAIYGAHGDAPHIVTAATGIRDCLFTAQWSVALAEALQVPVIMLTDQAMGQAQAVVSPLPASDIPTKRLTVDALPNDYQRYADTGSGVSPMAIPGTPGAAYTAEGLAHSPKGTPSTQSHHQKVQLDKRLRKIQCHDYGTPWAEFYGPKQAKWTIITFGSLNGAAREAADRLNATGSPVRVITLRLLAPLLTDRLMEALEGAERILVVEQTHGGQLIDYLRSRTPFRADVRSCRRAGPVPLRPGEIVAAFNTWESEAPK